MTKITEKATREKGYSSFVSYVLDPYSSTQLERAIEGKVFDLKRNLNLVAQFVFGH